MSYPSLDQAAWVDTRNLFRHHTRPTFAFNVPHIISAKKAQDASRRRSHALAQVKLDMARQSQAAAEQFSVQVDELFCADLAPTDQRWILFNEVVATLAINPHSILWHRASTLDISNVLFLRLRGLQPPVDRAAPC